jgi:hypothetical protein
MSLLARPVPVISSDRWTRNALMIFALSMHMIGVIVYDMSVRLVEQLGRRAHLR